MKELVAALSSEGFSSVRAHRCRHTHKINLWHWRRQGLQSMRRRGDNSWVALARATPEPGGNRNPPNRHSFWTKRERGKTCPKLRQTHWDGKEHFFWKKHQGQPPRLIYKHQGQPQCLIVPKSPFCPWGHTVAGPAGQTGRWVGELNTSSLAMEKKPGKRRSVQGHQHYGKHPPALGSPQEGTKFPQDSLGLQQRRQRKEGACELSKESPEPTRVVEQPALTKALVRGAGTAEEDPSEQKAQ